MDYFFYNTDSNAIIDEPKPRFGVLIESKFAAVGGDRQKFGEQLGKLNPDDILLMYENLVGIVALGRVLESWDEVTHSDSLYYTQREMALLTGGAYEYRIAVDWFINISNSPFRLKQLRELLGYTPRGTIKKIVKYRDKVERLISEIRSTQAQDHPQHNSYLPCKEEIKFAESQLRKFTDEIINMESVLDQVETNFKKAGKPLKDNWRFITKLEIPKWFSKNECSEAK